MKEKKKQRSAEEAAAAAAAAQGGQAGGGKGKGAAAAGATAGEDAEELWARFCKVRGDLVTPLELDFPWITEGSLARVDGFGAHTAIKLVGFIKGKCIVFVVVQAAYPLLQRVRGRRSEGTRFAPRSFLVDTIETRGRAKTDTKKRSNPDTPLQRNFVPQLVLAHRDTIVLPTLPPTTLTLQHPCRASQRSLLPWRWQHGMKSLSAPDATCPACCAARSSRMRFALFRSFPARLEEENTEQKQQRAQRKPVGAHRLRRGAALCRGTYACEGERLGGWG